MTMPPRRDCTRTLLSSLLVVFLWWLPLLPVSLSSQFSSLSVLSFNVVHVLSVAVIVLSVSSVRGPADPYSKDRVLPALLHDSEHDRFLEHQHQKKGFTF